VELSFYLIAPFILRRRAYILALFSASILLRMWLIHIGIGSSDPWTYRFFPTELAYFLLGAISHQVLMPIYRKSEPSTMAHAARYATAGILLVVCLYSMINVSAVVKSTMLFGLCFFVMPLLFIFPRQCRFDNWIGDLSYPLYICHILVIWIVSVAFSWLGIRAPRALSLVSVALSLLAAVGLERFIGAPMERMRKHLKTRGHQGSMGRQASHSSYAGMSSRE
jgi:peptidoglycan/LPS O-acetylase OafA/YrhL